MTTSTERFAHYHLKQVKMMSLTIMDVNHAMRDFTIVSSLRNILMRSTIKKRILHMKKNNLMIMKLKKLMTLVMVKILGKMKIFSAILKTKLK